MSELRDFDANELFRALDRERERQGLSWSGVARDVWAMSAILNERRHDHPISPSTFSSMDRRGNVSCQHALFMLRWLDRTPESFLSGPSLKADVPLPVAEADRRLRWNLRRLYDATNEERQLRNLTWSQLASALSCTPSQLTGLRTAKFATGMTLAMRIAQWLGRPSADFIDVTKW